MFSRSPELGRPEAPVPVVFCIDVEPDGVENDPGRPSDWRGFEVAHSYFSSLRPRLAAATGSRVHFSWFIRMDPQIERIHGEMGWAAARYGPVFSALERAGDELGVHTHLEREWSERTRRWRIDFGDAAWFERCVRESLGAFSAAFGRPCRSFRAGTHFMTDAASKLIEELGIQFDLTVESGLAPFAERGWSPFRRRCRLDYRKAPRHPYRPSSEDFRRPASEADRALWILPVSSARRAPTFLRPGRPFLSWVSANVRPPFTTALCPGFYSRSFLLTAERVLERHDTQNLVLVMRSDVPLRRRAWLNVRRTFEGLLDQPWARRLVFSTPAEVVAGLEHG